VSSNGLARSQGIPLYDQPYSPCRHCCDAGRCPLHNLKNHVCMRYMRSRLTETLTRAAEEDATVVCVDARHTRQARQRAEELGLSVRVMTAPAVMAGLSAGQVFMDELYRKGRQE